MPASPFIGEIYAFPYTFAPHGYARCDGTVLPIAQNQTLFQILGNAYGGDGTTTFALPDLRGRMAIGAGQGPGLGNYLRGQTVGAETVALDASTTANHDHLVTALHGPTSGTSGKPAGHQFAYAKAYGTTANGTMAPDAVGSAGSGQGHENRPPVLALNYCIAMQGVYPSHP
jgi:microcystin-dependent protein